MKSQLAILFLFISFVSQGQFWLGPKVGFTLTHHVYDDPTFKNNYDVKPNVNWHAGLSMDYDSEGHFAVHSELTYERVANKVQSKPGDAYIDSKSVYHFISVPMMARVILAGQRGSLKFYGSAGPRLKVWIAGNGITISDEFIENGFDGKEFKVEFKKVRERDDSKIGEPYEKDGSLIQPGNEFIVEKANRVQYSLDIGGGAFLDLRTGHRINFDARYSFGHSNMGFNVDNDGLNLAEFNEDLEYHHNMLTLSVAFLWGYDPMAMKKGKSTQGGRKARKK